MELGAKFCIGMGLSPDNRPDPRLCQTDDPPGDAVALIVEHDALLLINRGYQIQTICLLLGQFDSVLHKFCDISHVSPDVLQLFFDSRAERPGTALFALGQPEKIPAGTLAVHSRLLLPSGFTNLIHRLLQLLPRLIQQIHVLRIGDIRRTAGGVQHQCPAVGRVIVSIFLILLLLRLGDGRLQNRRHVLLAEPLPKRHQRRGPKGTRTILFHPNEELQIRIFFDVLHQPVVTALQPPLDEQRS